MFMRVDLPEPEGPMIATYSLRLTTRSTPRSARTDSPPIRYSRRSPSTRMTGASASGLGPGVLAAIMGNSPSE